MYSYGIPYRVHTYILYYTTYIITNLRTANILHRRPSHCQCLMSVAAAAGGGSGGDGAADAAAVKAQLI